MRVLDLFCGAGGASEGYVWAGATEVEGVDRKPFKRYKGKLHVADALEFLSDHISSGSIQRFDLVHASPPCQRFSTMTKKWGTEDEHPDLIAPVRELLIEADVPYVIENVPGAPLENPVMLCGSHFSLKVRRHRLFETNFRVKELECDHKSQGRVVGVYGNTGGSSKRDGITFGGVDAWRDAMQIDWMVASELREAIPPAYTQYIGEQFLRA